MITDYSQLKYPYPKSLSEFGITIEEYNSLNLNSNKKLSADIWFGTCCHRPVSNFAEVARIRNISNQSVRIHILRTMEAICEYNENKLETKKQDHFKKISDDIRKLSLALLIHQEIPFISYQTYKEYQYD